MDLKSWIEAFASIVQAASVPLTVYIAYRGLTQWRSQAKAEKNAMLAEEIEIGLSELVEAVHRIRDPFGYAGDGQTRPRDSNESEKEAQHRDRAFTTVERLRKEDRILGKMTELEVRANVRFPNELAGEMAALRRHIRLLSTAAASRYRASLDEERGDVTAEEKGRRRKNDEIIWSVSRQGDLDPFDHELEQLRLRVIAKLEPHKI
jgi:hypothetical protein